MGPDKEILINLVRNEPRLWDQRIKTYHNRDIQTSLWESIGKELLVEEAIETIMENNFIQMAASNSLTTTKYYKRQLSDPKNQNGITFNRPISVTLNTLTEDVTCTMPKLFIEKLIN